MNKLCKKKLNFSKIIFLRKSLFSFKQIKNNKLYRELVYLKHKHVDKKSRSRFLNLINPKLKFTNGLETD